MAVWLLWVGIVLVTAYLFGSLPTGYVAGRLLKGIDIREHGSGSTGATNVLRTLGKVPALVVFLVDVGKGSAAVLLARWLYHLPAIAATVPADLSLSTWIPWAATIAGLAALLGHSKSVWINFTGGKSVATGLGTLLAISWAVGLSTLAVFGVVLALTRIVSLSSIAAAIAVSGLALALHEPLPHQLMAIAGGLYVIVRHRANIQRLFAGTEPRLGQNPSESTELQLEQKQQGS
jgi:acyl phosphate:glycerol-3-phosphate acyltransferase